MRLRTWVALLASLLVAGVSQAAEINWQDEVCKNTVTFDARKHDSDAVRNTINLLFWRADIRNPHSIGSFVTPEQAARADLTALEKECADIVRSGQVLKLLPLPNMEGYRAALLDMVRDSCAFHGAKMRALKDPAALRAYSPAAACSSYIDALEGLTDLDQVWRDVVEGSCQRNAAPAACRSRHMTDAERADGLLRKKLVVLNFGWNNCAVRYMRANAFSPRNGAMRTALQESFKRQFTITRTECNSSAAD